MGALNPGNKDIAEILAMAPETAEDHGGEYFADKRLTIADLKAFVVLRWLSSGVLGKSGSERNFF